MTEKYINFLLIRKNFVSARLVPSSGILRIPTIPRKMTSKAERRRSLRTSRTTGTPFGGWPPFPQRRTSLSNPRTVAGVAQENDIGDRTKTQQGQSLAVGGPTEILDPFRIIGVSQLP